MYEHVLFSSLTINEPPQMSTKLLYVAIGLAFFGVVCYAAVDIRLNAGASLSLASLTQPVTSCASLCPLQCAITAVSSTNLILGSTSAPPSTLRLFPIIVPAVTPLPFHPPPLSHMYLVEHGWEKFITWYDYESWYPIGRPIGKSIYPGMQVAAAVIHWFLKAVGQPLPLNDVCVRANAAFVPSSA